MEDKSGGKVRLSKAQWAHINEEHPEVAPFLEEIREAVKRPSKVSGYPCDEKVRYYYKHFKSGRAPDNYLLVIVKYLNGDGFVITAYFVRKIK